MDDDLKKIKKHYGEDMMHLCRELFSTILEIPGLLYSLMEEKFAPNHYLCDDIVFNSKKIDFKDYIYSLIKQDKKFIQVTKTPFELMDEAGYILYECKNEEDILKFKKYYILGEGLCTFSQKRLNRCYVFFAVKKNVDEIKRENFSKPERQDEYGTSVISIQFSHGNMNTLSIKNRYNHIVSNPDATFSNNLDNIIPGLSASFEDYYRLNICVRKEENFEMSGYVKANDGKYYKYNYKIDNVYYCPGNIIIDNYEVIRDYQEKEKYIIVDYFIIDLVKKEVRLYDYGVRDSFSKGIKNIKKIEVTKDKDTGNKMITLILNDGEDIIIEIDKFNRIIGYTNNNLVEINDQFLIYNKVLKNIQLLNIVTIGNSFLSSNKGLVKINFPKLKEVGNDFLSDNSDIESIYLPELEFVGDRFLTYNVNLTELKLPCLKKVGRDFITENKVINILELPLLEKAGNYFLSSNISLLELNLPNLRIVGNDFLSSNKEISELNLPRLESALNNFLRNNNCLREINLPNLMLACDNFMYFNESLMSAKFPKLETVGLGFLYKNEKIESIDLSSLMYAQSCFMTHNNKLTNLSLPSLRYVENYFLSDNSVMIDLYVPRLESVGVRFLHDGKPLIKKINMNKINEV